MHLNEFSSILRIVGDERRITLLCALLKSNELTVGEAANATNMSVALASHHLRAMAEADILIARRDGKSVIYCLSDAALVRNLCKLIRSHVTAF